jgi:hypothetical protein
MPLHPMRRDKTRQKHVMTRQTIIKTQGIISPEGIGPKGLAPPFFTSITLRRLIRPYSWQSRTPPRANSWKANQPGWTWGIPRLTSPRGTSSGHTTSRCEQEQTMDKCTPIGGRITIPLELIWHKDKEKKDQRRACSAPNMP